MFYHFIEIYSAGISRNPVIINLIRSLKDIYTILCQDRMVYLNTLQVFSLLYYSKCLNVICLGDESQVFVCASLVCSSLGSGNRISTLSWRFTLNLRSSIKAGLLRFHVEPFCLCGFFFGFVFFFFCVSRSALTSLFCYQPPGFYSPR